MSDGVAATNTIVETETTGTVVSGLRLQAVDESGVTLLSANIEWSLSEDAGGIFAIRATSGVVYLASPPLDYESTSTHSIVVLVVASKEGGVTLTEHLAVEIAVLDVLESLVITDSQAIANTVAENAATGTVVAGLIFAVADEAGHTPAQTVWSLTDSAAGRFTYDAMSGVVSLVSAPLDYESTRSYTIEVSAVATKGGVTLTAYLTAEIAVLDVLEALVVTDSQAIVNTLAEHAATHTVVAGLNLQAQDEIGTTLSSVLWSIAPDHGLFTINSTTGVVHLSHASLNYEMTSSYTMTASAVASKAAGVTLTSSLSLTVAILDVLEQLTVTDGLAATNTIADNATVGTTITGLDLRVVDESGVVPAVRSWSLVDSGNGLFAIDAQSGVVRLTQATLDYQTVPSYVLVAAVHASKAADVTLTTSLTITVVLLDILEQLVVIDRQRFTQYRV